MEPEFEQGKRVPQVTKELEKKLVKKVRKILENENLYEMTEKKVREKMSAELEMNLSDEPFKSIVRRAVLDFLEKLRNRTR